MSRRSALYEAGATPPPVSDDLIITIVATAGMTYVHPLIGLNNNVIEWGDGQSGTYSGDAPTHTYTNAGEYTITSKETITSMSYYQYPTSKNVVKRIDNGGLVLKNMTNQLAPFYNMANLESINSTFENLTTGYYAFANCPKLKYIYNATFGNVINADYMFLNCFELMDMDNASFDSVTSAASAFSANYNIVSFQNATFENLINGNATFANCNMLKYMPKANFKNLESGSQMMSGVVTLDTVDYSNILIRTRNSNPKSNVVVNFGMSKYNSSAITARAELISIYNWSIADGGLA